MRGAFLGHVSMVACNTRLDSQSPTAKVVIDIRLAIPAQFAFSASTWMGFEPQLWNGILQFVMPSSAVARPWQETVPSSKATRPAPMDRSIVSRRSSTTESSAALPSGKSRMCDLPRSSATSRTVSRPRADSRASRMLNISGAAGCGSPEKLVALLGISAVGGKAEVWRGLIVFRMAVSPSSSVGEPCGNSACFFAKLSNAISMSRDTKIASLWLKSRLCRRNQT